MSAFTSIKLFHHDSSSLKPAALYADLSKLDVTAAELSSFYRDICGMTDVGPGQEYSQSKLRYFEMTKDQAEDFVREEKQ